MAWWMVIVAGLLEVAWAVGLKKSEGFTRPIPSVLTLVGMAASFWLLGAATKTLPIGTAYAVWVGIGAAGAAMVGALFLGEPLGTARIIFLMLLVISIVGLRLTA
jgi:quaternary ammonium compound-resistance protein SugE